MTTKPLILIVDDAPSNVQVLAHILSDRCKVSFALSGEQALEFIARTPPELILLDVQMPGMDGYEVLRQLKGEPATRDIPVIFVTAMSDSASESAALAAGAMDFIHKPINPDVVRARVDVQLALRAKEVALRLYNDKLEELVAERTTALRKAQLAAEAASVAKTHFLGNMSHELRTPLHQLSAMIHLLQRTELSDKQKNLTDKMVPIHKRLIDLVDGILKLTELESRTIVLREEPFDAGAVVEEVVEESQARATAKQLQLVADADALLGLVVTGDPANLRIALQCYLGNALTYTEKGSVCVVATREAEAQDASGGLAAVTLRFEVRDTGIGIPADAVPRLFSIFEQVDNSPTRRFGGTGIGLVTVKKLAEAMGGTAGCSSEVGQGSRFWFTIRVRCAGVIHADSV
ncbi:response regulator [Zoogloea sp.]|uniref:ATP-binding response regulator n=1 Tax=Zoogloea sp. TaxID=49181 RepID=UPI0035B3001A